jgi:hypothetical protein
MSLPINSPAIQAAIKEYYYLSDLPKNEKLRAAYNRIIKEWHCSFIINDEYISGVAFDSAAYETAFLLRYS